MQPKRNNQPDKHRCLSFSSPQRSGMERSNERVDALPQTAAVIFCDQASACSSTLAGQETSNSICAKVGPSQNSITQTSSPEIKLEFREMTRELLDTWGCGG
ncbi:hypothetical protein TNIN_30331 [Trichonephila inaurata madagascariensis]|uniref:Uncharacterized protein n=1 Tax=Trichonephila inaurata madagascariensis TaxID=2747483 RepID=A0A8X6YH30_9ARAC|nr:hypothetical protein TNIN_30331 [Trichonephila inaurata madagascariensis]